MVLATRTVDIESLEPSCDDTVAAMDPTADQDAGEMQLAVTVGKNLRSHRIRRGMTLERLAKTSGVSRAMLSQVELGRSTPSIKVVWKVARALGLPFSALISDGEVATCCVVRQGDSRVLASQDGKFRSRALFPFTGSRNVEFYELRLLDGATEQARAHDPGTVENLVVAQGELELIIERRSEHLSVGDSIIFDADVMHSYVNRGHGHLVMYLVLSHGERSQ